MRDALLQALHDDPADLASWSVLADWLDDHDEPERADLVRLRIFLAGTGDSPQRPLAEERVREILFQGIRPCVPTLVNSVGMELALVPAGSFYMGSPRTEFGRAGDEDPRHPVEITRPFYLGVCLVTQDEYRLLSSEAPSHFSAHGTGRLQVQGLDTARFPVDSVSWDDAVGFCARLSNLPAEQEAGRIYRLPTEAEWEYACRAGATADPFQTGDCLSSLWANFDGQRPAGGVRRGPFLERTCAVGSYLPNAWGLFDLHGNLWEWCADWYDARYYAGSPTRDPQGPSQSPAGQRCIRGGAWNFPALNCRTAYRLYLNPATRTHDVGFRVACVHHKGERRSRS
jgi:uncharacterized protein (TIGR02996 family)